jgi:hypothetical protein
MPDPATRTAHVTPDAPTDGRPPVELLRWPEQDDRRRLLATLGRPRLLLLAPDAPPPTLLDDLELWIPDGSDPNLIATAVTALQQKVLIDDSAPVLDDDGLLWFQGRWVAIPDAQLPVVDLLVRNYKRLVHNDDLRHAYQRAGGSGTYASLRALIGRVNQRLTELGLDLQVIRRRGVLLTHEPAINP